MDTRMIEVALGLALVFALTSLFVTALRELWSSVWGSRSKVLNLALASFLGDDKDFANKLMKHPLLVSLAKDDADGKPRPSYMGAQIVVTSLIASLIVRSTAGIRSIVHPCACREITSSSADRCAETPSTSSRAKSGTSASP